MDNLLHLIGRTEPLFTDDIQAQQSSISAQVKDGSFLVIGGAGSIGQAVVKELFQRQPKRLLVVDINENNLVELVRDLRSSLGYIDGEFRTFVLDCGSREFDAFFAREGPFDYILNLSALKHVRSERDPYTLMRMIVVNVLNTNKVFRQAVERDVRKFFCVSTDKATNPANVMGASKRVMEMHLMQWSPRLPVSMARFANVAFSDGSLLHGFSQRILKRQPLSAPFDVKRYFITPQEAGELCVLSCLRGENRDILFPKLSDKLHLITFADIARRFLRGQGYEPRECPTEEEARARMDELTPRGQWPCYFFRTDTTGEKDFEEFTTSRDVVDLNRFKGIGVIMNPPLSAEGPLQEFSAGIDRMRSAGEWTKEAIVDLFRKCVPEFSHVEMHKNLDNRM